MGCDMVQGYYFSKPLPPEEYEFFVEERQKRGTVAPAVSQRRRRSSGDDSELRIGRIAYALSNGFESIYYVDMENDHYVEFSSKGKYADLQIQRSGSDFFADTKKNLEIVVYPDDRERVRLSLQKDVLEAHLLSSDSFSLTYRLLIDGAPVYYNLKAVKASKADTDHVVIGVSNVANQMHQAIHDESENSHGLTFFNIAEILSNEFESVYCVDIATNSYTEYTAQGPYEKVKMEMSGENFFDDCQKNIRTAIALEDQAMMSRMLEKQTLLDILEKQDIFYLDYHLLVQDTPVPYRMKIVKSNDQLHILVGVSDWSKEKAIEQKFEAVTKDKVTYASIAQALAADFFSIYYIDTETNEFIEFSAHDDYKELGIEKRGKDFFDLTINNILRVVYEEDREMLCRAITKENILSELEANGVFTLTYRLMLNDEPTYVSMKVTSMMDKSDKHIVVGVNNIDAQMKREAELGAAREIANRDALTGVKSKHAYLEMEQSLNRKMETGGTDPFAVVICDVNGLKQVNDTYGHKAGDKYLKNACMQICRVFKHSPVFRIGGDEFLALLCGKDYANRMELLAQMAVLNEKHRASGEVIIASGMAEYKPDMDRTVSAVFDRADAEMYKNKKSLKTER